MQQPLFPIFERLNDTKAEQKKLKKILKEALEDDPAYARAIGDLSDLKAKVKTIESDILSTYQSEQDKLDTLKADIENDKLVMTDEALKLFKADKPLTVKDKKGIEYEAEFSVRFKKIK